MQNLTAQEKAQVLAENLRNTKYAEPQIGKTGLVGAQTELTPVMENVQKVKDFARNDLMQKLMQVVNTCIADGRDYTVRYFPLHREIVRDSCGNELVLLSRRALITVSTTNDAQIGDLVAFDNSFPRYDESPVVQSSKNLGAYLHWEKETYGWRLTKVDEVK